MSVSDVLDPGHFFLNTPAQAAQRAEKKQEAGLQKQQVVQAQERARQEIATRRTEQQRIAGLRGTRGGGLEDSEDFGPGSKAKTSQQSLDSLFTQLTGRLGNLMG